MNVQSQPTMTVDAFFRWAENRPEKYELVNGVPCMLPWVKLNHSRIVTNLTIELAKQLDRDRLEVVTSDFGVRVGQNSVRFPDLMVLPAGTAGDSRETDGPLLIVEILSDSTMHADFGEKRREYLTLQTLKAYVIVAQEKRHAWCWARDCEGDWPADPAQVVESGAEIEIAALGLSIPLETIYVGVN
jgi:Uma2 family endonuclease